MYQWFLVNSTTGAIGVNSSSHSPMITVSTTAADGTVTTTTEFDPALIPSGFTVLGPYDTANPMPASYEVVFATPAAYLYQSGGFANNPAWPAAQLAQAQQTQNAALQAGCNSAFNAGFASAASGSALTYGFKPSDQANLNELATMLSLGVATWPVSWQTPDGTIVSLTQAQFTSLLTDAQKFKWAQINQLRSLQAQVQAATTVSAVQAVVWTAATY